jgi:hypothetical protein
MSKKSLVPCGVVLSAFLLLHCSSDDEPEPTGSGASPPSSSAGATSVGGSSGGLGSNDGGVSGMSAGRGGGGDTSCNADFPECCAEPEGLPCKELSEKECRALAGQYCMPVVGVPYQDGSLGGAGPGYDDGVYIGCFSLCGGDLPVVSCTQNPDEPAACYHTPSAAAPDGWTVFDCESAPAACAE